LPPDTKDGEPAGGKGDFGEGYSFHAISGRGTIKSENCNPDARRRRVVVHTLRTQDFDELAHALPRWDLRCQQLGRGPFKGQLQVLQLGGIQVFRIAANRILHFEGWPPPDSFGCFPVLPANENAVWGGRRLKTGQVRVSGPGLDADHVTAAGAYQLVGLVLDGAVVREALPVLGECDSEKRLPGTEAVTTSPAGCRALWANLVGLLNGAQARPALPASPRPLIEQECLRPFLALLARPKHDRIACEPHNRARLVRRAEDYMQANRAEPLSVLELCRELGVSERTLHYAFQEVRGTSPMAYFRALRLNAVRQELRAAADTATVHEIAQRWGFWHTGEFAADYQRLFGELPSQTRNR
jgi:AraC family ethanolamine operon transcriptional activator